MERGSGGLITCDDFSSLPRSAPSRDLMLSFTSTPPSPPLGWCSATNLPAFIFRFLLRFPYQVRISVPPLLIPCDDRDSSSKCGNNSTSLVLWHCVEDIAGEDSLRRKRILNLVRASVQTPFFWEGSYNGCRRGLSIHKFTFSV
jgi:hypothetical protein